MSTKNVHQKDNFLKKLDFYRKYEHGKVELDFKKEEHIG